MQKMNFFRQFRDHKEGNMETWQMTPFISEFEITENLFLCGPSFCL